MKQGIEFATCLLLLLAESFIRRCTPTHLLNFCCNTHFPHLSSEPNVDIGVHCNKKKVFDKLSVAEGTFVGKTLQQAFAKVHKSAGGEEHGSHLDNTFFHSETTLAENPEKDGNLRFCNWCRIIHSIFSFAWSGSWDCGTMCPNDDDMLSSAMTNHMAAWQAEFVALLNQGPFKKFRGITQCQIKMKPHALTVEEQQQQQSAASLASVALPQLE